MAISLEKQRIRYIDTARGLGMICIILGHLGNDSINRFVYTFHVPLFLIIAGYFISEKKDIGGFIKSRARSLLVPYAVTCLIMILLATFEGVAIYGTGGFWNTKMWTWAAVYGSGASLDLLFFVREVGAIWFLWALFWSSIAVRCSLKMNRWVRPVFIAALFAAAYLSSKVIWLPFSLQPGLCAAAFVYVGWLVRQYSGKLKQLPAWVKWAALVAAAAAWAVFIWKYDSFWLVRCDFGRGIGDIAMCLCACACVMFISYLLDRIPGIGRLLSWEGRYSLIILCIHNIELNFFPWKYCAQYLADHGMPRVLFLPLIIAGKLAADLFCAWLLLKAKPVRKLFCY